MDTAVLTTLLSKSLLRFLYTIKILRIQIWDFPVGSEVPGTTFKRIKRMKMFVFRFMELKTEGHSTSRIPIPDKNYVLIVLPFWRSLTQLILV